MNPRPSLTAVILLLPLAAVAAADRVPRFSVEHLDRSASPRTNFFQFAAGSWIRANPVPADKARWASFDELAERNWHLIRHLLEEAAASDAPPGSPERLVGDFFAAGLDTERLEQRRFQPIEPELARLDRMEGPDDAAALVGAWHRLGIGACFSVRVGPDARDSGVYALHLGQGGLGMPDREYYLAEAFERHRRDYHAHITATFQMLGEMASDAGAMASWILEIETELARSSRSRTELRDREANYHRQTPSELRELAPDIAWDRYFRGAGIAPPAHVIVGQPEFFRTLNRLGTELEPEHWLAYLRWHLVRNAAPHLHAAAADASFRFFGTVLQGQPQPEPRWQRLARLIDGGFAGRGLGEALGQLFVARHFPPAARERMAGLVGELKAVFRDRLGQVEWMTPETRRQALLKFERFTARIGHPDSFRDYSDIEIRRDDHFGNVRRTAMAAFDRDTARIGARVDTSEWRMTPQTVNAYFNPTQNEIVFPAGILQPPFFDLTLDDAVNFGAIGAVIGHEITHGFDDQGRKSDADGNLRDWWSEADAREFERRAAKLVEQYGRYEPLPGASINGRLTLGENIADLGGVSIAFEALQRALARDPSQRQTLDGFTPEQRFFLAYAQIWRVNTREAELRRRLVIDPHAPPQYRAFAPLLNLAEFHAAFDIRPGDPMWRAPEDRARIW